MGQPGQETIGHSAVLTREEHGLADGGREGGNEEMDGRERERIYKRISRENEGKIKGKRGEN